jgi:hypothetical protein
MKTDPEKKIHMSGDNTTSNLTILILFIYFYFLFTITLFHVYNVEFK